jgi:predicted RNase H-like HicB family nuclease
MERITVESIPIVVGREEDGRWWADIESMPGVMAYGATRESAIGSVRALALRVAADCIEHGEEIPEPLPKSFRWHEPLEISQGQATDGCLAANRVGGRLAERFSPPT